MFKKKIDIIAKLKRTFKNKKITSEEKVAQMIQNTSYYFQNELERDAIKCTYDLYYERFMIDDKIKNKIVFEKFYNYEYKNILYKVVVYLNRYFVDLQYKVDSSKLTQDEQKIFKSTILFSQKCCMNASFDYTRFYNNEGVRELICENLNIIENDFKNLDYKSNNDLYSF